MRSRVQRFAPCVLAALAAAGAPRAGRSYPFIHEPVDSQIFADGVGLSTSLALGATGNPRIAYFDAQREDLEFAFRDGPTWVNEVVDSTGVTGLVPSLAVAPDGTPHILYFDLSTSRLRHAWKPGPTWVIETVDSPFGRSPAGASLRIDAGGNLHAAYSSDGFGVRYAVRGVGGWRPETIAPTGFTASLALDRVGSPTVCYSTGTSIVYAVRIAGGWRLETVADTSGGQPFLPVLALDAADVPRVAYGVSTLQQSFDLVYATRTASGWVRETVVQRYGLEHSLALGRDGTPHLGLSLPGREGPPEGIVYATRTATGWRFDTVDANVTSGASMSIALDTRGEPRLSYTRGDPGFVRYAEAAPVRIEPLGTYQLWSSPRIVSIPGVAAPRLSDLLGPVLGSMSAFTWKGFGLTGSVLEPDPVFDVGRGYWVNTLIAVPEGFELPGDIDSAPRLELLPGWNILGAPALSPIVDTDVCFTARDRIFLFDEAVTAQIIASVAFHWEDATGDLVNNGKFVSTDLRMQPLRLRPGRGTLVFAQEPALLQYGCEFSAPTAVAPPPLAWSLELTAASAGRVDRLLVGTAADARDDHDIRDWPKPPAPVARFGFGIEHRDWGALSGPYMRSIQSATAREHRWPLAITRAGAEVRIEWPALEALPPGLHAYFVLPGGAAVLVEPGSSFSAPTLAGRYDLEIRATPDRWAGPTVQSGFDGGLTVANAARGHLLGYQIVRPTRAALRVFDARGRLIRDFGRVPGEAGTHRVHWDERTGNGARVAAGVYFARLVLDTTTSTARVVVLH